MDFWSFFKDGIRTLILSPFLLLVAINEYLAAFVKWLFSPKPNLPPGPIGLPLVGYLPFLGDESFKTLDQMKDKYGNIFSLKMGRTTSVVLADYPTVTEIFNKPSSVYKPPGLFDFLPGGLGFSGTNGEVWQQQRRFAVKSMKDLGAGRSPWSALVESEVSDFLHDLRNRNGEPVAIIEVLASSTLNSITSLVLGRRLPPGPDLDSINNSMKAIIQFISPTSLYNYFPWLGNIFRSLGIGNYEESFKEKIFLNNFLRSEAQSHMKSKRGVKGADYMSQYIEVMELHRKEGRHTVFNERNLIGDSETLLLGGSDTTVASLSWLFLGMVSYPEVQRKVHAELDSVLGERGAAAWDERMSLPYNYAVMLEAQRWRTVGPLVSRITVEDMKCCGYDIPKGTSVLGNLWGIHNNPKYWPEPEKFIPERFLLNDGKDVNLKAEAFLPFSTGRRKCPGEIIAIMGIFHYFTATMKQFEVRMLPGEKPDLNGIEAIVYHARPQNLCFIPRA